MSECNAFCVELRSCQRQFLWPYHWCAQKNEISVITCRYRTGTQIRPVVHPYQYMPFFIASSHCTFQFRKFSFRMTERLPVFWAVRANHKSGLMAFVHVSNWFFNWPNSPNLANFFLRLLLASCPSRSVAIGESSSSFSAFIPLRRAVCLLASRSILWFCVDKKAKKISPWHIFLRAEEDSSSSGAFDPHRGTVRFLAVGRILLPKYGEGIEDSVHHALLCNQDFSSSRAFNWSHPALTCCELVSCEQRVVLQQNRQVRRVWMYPRCSKRLDSARSRKKTSHMCAAISHTQKAPRIQQERRAENSDVSRHDWIWKEHKSLRCVHVHFNFADPPSQMKTNVVNLATFYSAISFLHPGALSTWRQVLAILKADFDHFQRHETRFFLETYGQIHTLKYATQWCQTYVESHSRKKTAEQRPVSSNLSKFSTHTQNSHTLAPIHSSSSKDALSEQAKHAKCMQTHQCRGSIRNLRVNPRTSQNSLTQFDPPPIYLLHLLSQQHVVSFQFGDLHTHVNKKETSKMEKEGKVRYIQLFQISH